MRRAENRCSHLNQTLERFRGRAVLDGPPVELEQQPAELLGEVELFVIAAEAGRGAVAEGFPDRDHAPFDVAKNRPVTVVAMDGRAVGAALDFDGDLRLGVGEVELETARGMPAGERMVDSLKAQGSHLPLKQRLPSLGVGRPHLLAKKGLMNG